MKLIEKIRQTEEGARPFYSFEYFPPKTEAGLENLYARIERMGKLHPLFVDVTWGAGGSTADTTLDIATNVQDLTGLETMMHLTCTNMSRESLSQVLEESRQRGIQNILALRGDPPSGSDRWQAVQGGFYHAIDLVRFIRQRHGDYFGIGVAGYPDAHVESQSYRDDLRFLKEKVEAGSDFIITQLFYDDEAFLSFVDDCRRIGIECPIVPGVMPLHNYSTFTRVSRWCHNIPSRILEAIEPIKNDDAAVREYGVELMVEMCGRLLERGACGLHFYTLNLEQTVTRILDQLGLVPEQVDRALPWRCSANAKRQHEDVRPIFWANRPKSYLARTMEWDEFPNGRWGDSRSPAFGELSDYHLMLHPVSENKPEMWGEAPTELSEICEAFVRFCRGEIPAIPWYDSPLALESSLIQERLIQLNRRGFLTINSQPQVNGAPSEDQAVGWGGPGGRVFQKAYLEFFVSGDHIPSLIDVFERFSSLSYHAINRRGESYSNCESANAVTWGVFPGREIIQPTVVDRASFEVWKDEAFALWLSMWGVLYPEGSPSRRLIEHIHETFYLVNVVDNDFVGGDLWAVFDEVLAELVSEPPASAREGR